MSANFTIIDQGNVKKIEAVLEGETVLFEPKSLGWEVKPEGVCQGEVCIPQSADPHLVKEGRVNLNALAKLTSRPLALNVEEGAAYLGVSAQIRADQLSSLKAPDFTLPDLNGKEHSLSDYKGQKVLLFVYGSW